jgi:hypothetical protein
VDKKTEEIEKFSSIRDLHKSQDASELIESHDATVAFHSKNMEVRELCHEFLAGNSYSDEEREIARQKKKPLAEFNPLKTSERTFVGSMIQMRYDIKPTPREPTDQNKSDVYSAMYHWTADITGTRYKDPNLCRAAWAGGSAWQESFVEVTPGKKPRIHVTNENNFAIYPDPNRRDLIENSDCEFIDRVSWMSKEQLIDAIPDKEDEIGVALPDLNSSTYEKTKVYADRTHEYSNYRNGKYKVIERFYKVRKKIWQALTPQGENMPIGADVNKDVREDYRANYPDHTMYMERQEFLYLAIVCPAVGNEFLFNDEYHCQPRDPVTQKIMFPLIELIDEEIDGQPSGHIISQIPGIRMTNALLTNSLFAAKNAAGQSHTISQDHYDEVTIEDIEENHNDGSRSFRKKPNAPPGTGIDLIEQGRSAPDNSYLIDYASNYTVEVSSTPPSMKGMSEGGASGVLNEQRIQQAAVQTQPFNNNYSSFLIKRAKLWKAYWKEYWKAEEVIRVLEKKDDKDPDWITINQIVQDEYGNVQTKNSLDDADAYDITFEDSFKSPTVRDKVQKQLSTMMQNGSLQQDPELAAEVYSYFLMLSDAPQDFKNRVKQIAENKKKAQEAAAQAGPVPEPVRLSASIKAEDLHDQNMILFLENAKAIPPELAQQMLQSPPVTAEGGADLIIDKQAEAQARDQEMILKSAELRLKAQEVTEANQLKAQELEIKQDELELKRIQTQAEISNRMRQEPILDESKKHEHETNLQMMKIQGELEKAQLMAEASLIQAKMGHDRSDEARETKASEVRTKESEKVAIKMNAESTKAVEAIKKAQEKLEEKVLSQGEQITDIKKIVSAPKKVTIERDDTGKITGAVAVSEGVI